MAQKKWVINPKKYSEKKAWSYINIEHITEKSDRSSLQGVGTEQDK